MSQIGFTPPLSSDPINQASGVSSQNQVGNAGNKTVQENHLPVLSDSKTLHNTQPRKTLIENHGILRRPTSGGSARPTFASFRKSTTSTPATSQNQSVETPKTLRTSFASIKEQSPLGREGGQAMIGKNRSMPQAQAQTEVTQQVSNSETQKTSQRTFGSLNLHNTKQEKISRNLSSSKFSIGQQRQLNDKNIENGVRYYENFHSVKDTEKAQLLAKLAIIRAGGDFQITAGLFNNYSTEQLRKVLDFARLNTRFDLESLKTQCDAWLKSENGSNQLDKIKNALTLKNHSREPQYSYNTDIKARKTIYDEINNDYHIDSKDRKICCYCVYLAMKDNDQKSLKAFYKDLKKEARNKNLSIEVRHDNTALKKNILNVDVFMKLVEKHNIKIHETRI